MPRRVIRPRRHAAKKLPICRRPDEVVSEHLLYWDAIVRAVESSDSDELMNLRTGSRPVPIAQRIRSFRRGQRTVQATNMTEIALLETNEGEIPPTP